MDGEKRCFERGAFVYVNVPSMRGDIVKRPALILRDEGRSISVTYVDGSHQEFPAAHRKYIEAAAQ